MIRLVRIEYNPYGWNGGWCEYTLSGDHASNLNDRVDLRFWEDTFAPSTLDIKTENA